MFAFIGGLAPPISDSLKSIEKVKLFKESETWKRVCITLQMWVYWGITQAFVLLQAGSMSSPDHLAIPAHWAQSGLDQRVVE